MAGMAWEDPRLERIEVSTSGLTDTELDELASLMERWSERGVSDGIDRFWSLLAEQLRSVENWRTWTLARMAEDLGQF